jgi:3-oxoadipate enol-lactonase
MVFINSLGTDFRIWRDVIVRLAGEYAILTYDKRGHGLSDIGPTPYTIEDHATDLAALLDHIGARQAIVCGLSVGGQVALALYAARPKLVRALILSDTAAKIGTAESWDARIRRVEADGIEAIADGVLDGWFTAAFRDNPEFAGYRNMLIRQPVAGYVATCAALGNSDFTDVVKRIAVPTICIVGEMDRTATPALMADFARLIPEARFEVIKGAGHIPCVEQPAVFAEIIRAFVAQAGVEAAIHAAR